MAPLTPRIGLLEDDAELLDTVSRALRAADYEVVPALTGHEALAAFAADPPDALVLDIGLPDADGRDVCAALRARGVAAPVIFLTARDALTDRLSGFHAGGDDYLTKPFALAELLVRVGALLRRAPDSAGQPAGDMTGLALDPARHAVRCGRAEIALTPTEFRLLAALAARPAEVLRRGELVAVGWPDGAIVNDNTLDAYIARLRRKLRELGAPERIVTARGVGYRLQ